MVVLTGSLLLGIWIAVSLISRGIPRVLCEQIASFFPERFLPFIVKMQHGFYYEVSNINMPAEIFFVLFTLAFFIYGASILYIHARGMNNKSIGTIFLFAILFRLVLIPSVLIHKNAIYRYLWDGKVFLSGINPYAYPPRAADIMRPRADTTMKEKMQTLRQLRDEKPIYYKRIGYRDIPTIYPPMAQVAFAISNVVQRNSIGFMKLIFVLFDIGTLFVIYKLLLRFNMNPHGVIIYAWSPLVLKEIANSGHCDSLVIFFSITSILFLFRKKIWGTAICVSLGILSKFVPLVIVPFFIKRMKMCILFIIATLISGLYVPFFLWGGTGPLSVFKGLGTYARQWSINGGIFDFLYALVNSFWLPEYFNPYIFAKVSVGLLYVIIIVFLLLQKDENDIMVLKKLFWAVAWLFLLSPVGDPWYFCWIIPFLCFFPRPSFLLLSWLLIFSYIDFTRNIGMVSIGSFRISWLIVIQYVPFFVILIGETLYKKQRSINRV